MTPTSLGMVLVDGDGADGPTLARDELHVERRSTGVDVSNASEQVTAAALRLQTMVEAQGQRLRGIAVTWSDDASADAALLLESLTEAGFDNVVPVRFPHAAESLAQGVDPVAESDRTAVCVVEAKLATAVLMDAAEPDTPSVVQQEITGEGELVDWLAELFAPGRWRPAVLILAGTATAKDALAVRIERELALPVFVRTGAQLGLARGAAHALGAKADLLTTLPGPALADDDAADPERRWSLRYAGALAMLVVGVVSFVVSTSAAVSLELTPTNGPRPTQRVADAPAAPPVSHAVKPAVAEAPTKPPEPPAPPVSDQPTEIGSVWRDPQPEAEAEQPVASPVVPMDGPMDEPEAPAPAP